MTIKESVIHESADKITTEANDRPNIFTNSNVSHHQYDKNYFQNRNICDGH